MPDPAYGSLSFAEQIAFFRQKVNLGTQRWDDILGAAHDRSFVVAGAAKADLLADLRAAVTKAIEQGTTLAEFRKDFDALVARRGWTGWTGEGTAAGRAWRTRIIYETNLRASYAAGRWAQIQQVKAERPYLLYRHNDNVLHPRPLHVAWDGKVIAADDPWWRTHFPPNGWGCQCRVHAVDDAYLRKLGKAGPDPAPDDGTYDYFNKVSGVTLRDIPKGIDPGWDYAPGASLNLQEFIADKAAKLPGPIAQQFVDAVSALADTARPEAAIEAFSTVKGCNSDTLTAALKSIDSPQGQALERFITKYERRSLFLTETQMSYGSSAAKAITKDVADFLKLSEHEVKWAQGKFTLLPDEVKTTGGFTSPFDTHVVVKVGSRVDLGKINAKALRDSVKSTAESSIQPWRIRDTVRVAKNDPSLHMADWLHEIGHQVHFAAGTPDPPTTRSLSRYAKTDSQEWFAEHFSAWVLDRDALAKWDSAVADFFDNIMARL